MTRQDVLGLVVLVALSVPAFGQIGGAGDVEFPGFHPDFPPLPQPPIDPIHDNWPLDIPDLPRLPLDLGNPFGQPGPPDSTMVCRLDAVAEALPLLTPVDFEAVDFPRRLDTPAPIQTQRAAIAANVAFTAEQLEVYSLQERRLNRLQSALVGAHELDIKLSAINGILEAREIWPSLMDWFAIQDAHLFDLPDQPIVDPNPLPIPNPNPPPPPRAEPATIDAFSFYPAFRMTGFAIDLRTKELVPQGDAFCQTEWTSLGIVNLGDGYCTNTVNGAGSGCQGDPIARFPPFYMVWLGDRSATDDAVIAQSQAANGRALNAVQVILDAGTASEQRYVSAQSEGLERIKAYWLPQLIEALEDERSVLSEEGQWLDDEAAALLELHQDMLRSRAEVEQNAAAIDTLGQQRTVLEAQRQTDQQAVEDLAKVVEQDRALYASAQAALEVYASCEVWHGQPCDEPTREAYLEARYDAQQALARARQSWVGSIQRLSDARTLLAQRDLELTDLLVRLSELTTERAAAADAYRVVRAQYLTRYAAHRARFTIYQEVLPGHQADMDTVAQWRSDLN